MRFLSQLKALIYFEVIFQDFFRDFDFQLRQFVRKDLRNFTEFFEDVYGNHIKDVFDEVEQLA